MFVLRESESWRFCTPVILCIKSVYIYIFIPCIVYFWERNFHVSSNIIRDREHENDIIFQMIKIRSAISLQLYIIVIIIMCKHQ